MCVNLLNKLGFLIDPYVSFNVQKMNFESIFNKSRCTSNTSHEKRCANYDRQILYIPVDSYQGPSTVKAGVNCLWNQPQLNIWGLCLVLVGFETPEFWWGKNKITRWVFGQWMRYWNVRATGDQMTWKIFQMVYTIQFKYASRLIKGLRFFFYRSKTERSWLSSQRLEQVRLLCLRNGLRCCLSHQMKCY